MKKNKKNYYNFNCIRKRQRMQIWIRGIQHEGVTRETAMTRVAVVLAKRVANKEAATSMMSPMIVQGLSRETTSVAWLIAEITKCSIIL